MKPWLLYALMALVSWGWWAFLPKIAVKYMSPRSSLVYEVMGGMLVGVVVFATLHGRLQHDLRGIVPSVLTGIAGYLGLFFFLYAIQQGNVAVVAALTALYPVVTVTLAVVFLHEKINGIQWIGIGLAVLSVLLISQE